MQQKTLIALGAFVVIGVLAFLTLRAPDKGERSGPKLRPIPALKAADVKEIDLTANNGKDQVVLKAAGGGWKIVAPPFPTNQADQSLVKTAVEQLEKISFGDLVTQKAEKFEDLEVSDGKGAHVVAKDAGGKVLFDGWIGKSVAGFTMVRPGDKAEVWQATGLYKYTYGREAKAWRDHTIFEFNKDDVSRLAIEGGGQKLVLEKVPSEKKDATPEGQPKLPQEARWKVMDATVKVDPLDDGVANQMVMTLASLKAAEFDDTIKPADAGLATPRLKITATAKGAPMTLLIGNTKGDDNWVGVEGKTQVFLLHKYMLERLAQKPVDFRDKTIVKAKEDDLTALDITAAGESYTLEHAGSAWKVGKAPKGAKGEVDESKLKPVVSAFDDLKGGTFADESDPKATGLGKPSGMVTLHLRDRSTVTIKVGDTTADKTQEYVQKAGSADVLLVKKFQVDRFLKKFADVTKAGK
jgi:hypothetical protein